MEVLPKLWKETKTMSKAVILETTEEKWRDAQRDELHFWMTQAPDGEDWNHWWEIMFEAYWFIPTTAHSMLEVGCGPYAENTRRILANRPDITECWFNDPLLLRYIEKGCSVAKLARHGRLSYDPIEDMTIYRRFDLIVCINVLDHVKNVAKCFEKMLARLNPGGMLVFGNNLSNEQDLQQCPESWADTKHPIKMDFESLAPFLFLPYQTRFLRILPREQGRNPKAHYATLLWAGVKL